MNGGGITQGRLGWARLLAMALVAAFIMLYAAVLAVPLLSFSAAQKVGVASMLVVSGEVAFWEAALILGRGGGSGYRRFFGLRRWRRRARGRRR